MTHKAAIYDPYLDTLGGGERYCLTVAETLLKNNYSVDIFWNGSPDLISKAASRFSLELSDLKIVNDPFRIVPSNIDLVEQNPQTFVVSQHQSRNIITKFKSLFNKLAVSSKYDLIFFLSDGSVPLLLSKQNILHVQVPFSQAPKFTQKCSNFIKLLFIKSIVVNSKFTQNFSHTYYGKQPTVLYPPVDTQAFIPSTKSKYILSVGRFDNILNSKRQDIMIEAFQKMASTNPDWKLVLAGGSLLDEKDNNYLQHLKHISQNLPVEFVVNPKFDQLTQLYSQASIYWHAAGYQVDQATHPENTEHFGISIVEAMSAGAVPVAVNKGGIPEIINDSSNGFLWSSINDLVSKTQLLIGSPQLLAEMSQASIQTAPKFSKEVFSQNLLQIIK